MVQSNLPISVLLRGGCLSLLLTSVLFIFSAGILRAGRPAAPPNWTVDPGAYQFNMSIIARVQYLGVPTNASGNIVGVFVGNELRGVATPVDVSGDMFYFVTVYSNVASGENLKFKVYYQPNDAVYTSTQSLPFTTNALVGDIPSPYWIMVDNTSDLPPQLTTIPNDTTLVGIPFETINLATYLVSDDGDPVTYSAVAGANLSASISGSILTVTPVSGTWTGTDTVRVIATEQTSNMKSAAVTPKFTVNAFYAAPVLNTIPSQSRNTGQQFTDYDLDHSLVFSGSCRAFDYYVTPFSGTTANPGWTAPPPGSGPMTVIARPLFDDIQLAGSGAELAAFRGSTLIGKAGPSGTAPNITYTLTLANLGTGNITFKFYDAARQYLYTLPTSLAFVSGGSAGTSGSPYLVQFCPLTPTINPAGVVSIAINDNDWLGTLPVNYMVWDCPYPNLNSRRDTATASYTRFYSPNPAFTSAPAVNFQENTCLEPYDAQSYDPNFSEGSGLTYSIAGGADQSKFSINATTGKLGWNSFTPDFELPGDADVNNVYEVTIRVTNTNNLTADLNLLVTITNNSVENFAPTINGGATQACLTTSTLLTATGGGTYLWSTAQTTASIAVTIAGTYTVTVTNTVLCTGVASITVNQSPTVSLAGSSSLVCIGDQISLLSSPSGGTAPYTFFWTGPDAFISSQEDPAPFAASASKAGSYQLVVTDNKGCTASGSQSVVFRSEAKAALSLTASSPVCTGAPVTLTVTPTGGTTPYVYSWLGPNSFSSTVQNPPAFSAVAASAGTYGVTVTTQGGCVSTTSGAVVVNSSPAVTVSGATPVCQGSNIVLGSSTSGGTAPYSYLWGGPNSFTSTSATPIPFAATSAASGTYTVTVTDANGCTATGTRAISVSTTNIAPTVSTTGNSPVCAGSSIILTSSAAGGTTPYTYNWSGPAGFSSAAQNPAPFSASASSAGTYTVTVTNASGCAATATRIIQVNTRPVVSAASGSPVCSGGTVLLTSTAQGGSGGYSFAWTGPSGYTSSSEDPAGFTASPSTAGTYTVSVTDGNGCTGTATTVLAVSTAPAVAVTTGPTCLNNSLALNATASSGTLPYTAYSWSGPNSFTSASEDPAPFQLTAPGAGVYTVTVTDFAGCTATGSVTVTGNSSPTISASNSGPVCAGGQISLTSTPLGGTGAYSFLWSGPPASGYSAAFQNPSAFTAGASSAGVYTVTVTDANGCTGTGVTTVILNSRPVVSAANNGPLCFGSTALLTSTVTGGSGTYSGYTWSGPLGYASTSANPAGFVVNSVSQGGFYNLTVTDANGCNSTASTSLAVSSSSAPAVVASSNTPVCASGLLNLTATPSGGSGNYSGYSWAGPNSFTSSTQNPSVSSLTTSSGGTYTVTVTDVTGCTASSSTAVTVNGASLSVTKTDIACAGGNTGSATLIHTGGTPPYSYLWSNGGTTAAISGLVAGTYTVTITPQGGGTCTQTISTQISQASAVQVTLASSTSACGGANGSATVSVSGGTSPYTYLWPASAGNQTTATASALAAGTYTVTVTDNVLCTSTLAVTIASGTGTTISAIANKGPICPGAAVASTALSSTPSNSSTVFTWTGGASAGLTNGTSTGSGAVIPAFTAGLLEGAYVVTVTASLNTCASTTTFTITVEDNTPPVISNCPANLTINNTAGLCSGVVSWTPPTASDNCGSALLVQNGGPSIGAILSVGSTQTVSYTASDNGGNNATCSFTVTVSDTELPALNCPALSSSYGTDAGSCSYTIQGTTFNATASDNCGLQSGASGLSYVATGAYAGTGTQLGGVVLPRGTTVITWTATDVNNNTRTCSRTVAITDDDAPAITTCPPAQIMFTNSNGTGDCSGGVPDFLGTLVATDNCTSFANLVKIQNPASGTTFSGIHGDVQVVGITVIDDTGNSTYCSTTVTISDNEKPVFVNCPTVINLNNDVDQCGANVFFTPPGATDNCFGQIVITQISGTVPGTYVPVNTPQSVTFRAQDIAGNTESCQTTIVVNDVQSPVLVCPAGVQDFDASASCNYIGTLPLNASATDNCGIATLANNLNSTNSVVGYVFPLGNTVVIWTATDIYSNTQTCSYTVQVTDHTAPVISVCPPDRVINTSSNGTGDCTGPISNLLAELSVTDNCTSAGNLIKVQSPVSGSSFGTAHNDIQVIQYSVTDEAGNTSSCSTQLTLNDDENPVLTNCPPNLTASTTDQYPCYATRAWTHPGASDNCGISLLNFRILNPNNAVYGPVDIDPLNASYSFEVGNSVVTYQVADQKGNTATCSFSVIVTTVKSLVGNKIWHDQNGSGVQDAGEPGISGVLVTLSGTRLCDAALVSQTVTSDASGNYLFTDVEPGTYALTFGIPAGYIATAPGKGSDELLDSDFGSMGMTDPFNVLVADTILSLDAGFYIPGRIGDLVWDDLNGNGLQDAGEPGIAGAVVLLTGTSGDGAPVSMSTTTDASGYFVFGSTASGSTVLVPGSYQISFVTPSGGYVRTNANDPDGTDANDSDADFGTGAAVFEVISSGEYNTDYDAGFYRPASIGNYAWNDSNANGIQDVNELPLEGVSVVLTGVDGQGVAVSASKTTDANGYYTFSNLVPGVYHLNFAPPSGYALTGHDLGGDDTKDNDANESLSGRTADETLVSGENNTTYDAGFYAGVSLGNLVWLDKNANGVQDAGEPGLAGVIAKLLNGSGVPVTVDADDNPIVDQVTDANGNYQFTNLIPGSYRVRFTNPDVRYTLSKANQGTDDAQDCDADATTFTTHTTTLATGQYDPTLDAAYYIKGRVGNLAWHDINGNGVQDSGEPGLANTAVTLTGTDGFGTAATSSTTTDAIGFYTIGDIVPGSYKITFGVTPGGYTPTTADQGGNDATDSDYGVSGQTPVFTVVSADTILTFDAGYWLSTRIGSLVWDDTNGNGLQDAGEPGISGVSVILNGTEGDGDIVNLSTTTSATGEYAFGDQSSGSANLAPGTYNLTFVLPAGGYVPTRSNDTDGTDANDSDANEATGATAFEVLTSGENNPTYDAGFYLPPSIGNYAWNDSNANGTQEVDELPLEGVSVVLTGVDGQGVAVSATSTTDANGYYTFNNLVPGVYHLNFAPPSGYALTGHDLGGDDTKDNDANESLSGRTVDETLVSGENNTTYDAGFYAAVSVGNLVWLDKNANGVQDAGEPGLAGVIAQLLNGSGVPVTVDADDNPIVDQVTDANGNYQFTNLIPGSYRVRFTNPDVRYTLSKANLAPDDAQDSDADATTFTTHTTTLTTGQYDPTLDAAYYIKGRVGNLAWHDINGNGIQDSGEPGLANTAVTLTGTDGFGTAATSGTTTDAIGFYTIGDIVPGSYKITFGVTPGGYTPTTVDQGGNDATDSDYGVSGQTPVFTVVSADTILTFDAGYWLATRIGSLVWDDTNGNGLQDAGEPGISGVSVILNGTEGDGDIVNLSTTTSATGEYTFGYQSSGSANLAPGTYNLTFVLPAGGYVPTRSNDTDGTDSNDSDANEATGATAFEVLTSGENNQTYDAGFYLPPSIGNYAWNDSNANGVQEVDELPLEGVLVVLTGVDGQGVAVSATSTTDANGFYTFNNLVPGVYHLNFAPPSGYALTGHDLGGDDTKDNDANESLSGRTVDETLVSGENNTTYDAGFYAAVSVGNLVWLDKNANGVQDAGEPGLAGVIAKLLNDSGVPVAVDADDNPIVDQVTDANGNYQFTNLIPGSYRVRFTNPDVRYTLSKANQGTDDAQDCDADATTFTTHTTTLATGQYDPTLDAAYYIKGRVGNLAWHDINGNGVQDSGEPGLANTAVTLTGTDGFGTAATSSTTTDANGFYTIGNIVPGSYKLTFGVTPGGYTPTTVDQGGNDATDSDYGVSGQTPVFTVQSADTILTFDAGYWLATRIGSLVWDDTNGNGLQDAGEPGISGVSVILNGTEGDGDIVNLSTTTSATGEYTFGDQSSGSANLAPGTYNLTFVLPAGGYVPTRSNDTDGTDSNDSDANEATGATAFEVLTSGENNQTYDAGFYLPPSIGNYAWNDSNANGVQEVDELPLEGVLVVLTGIDGQGVAVSATSTTDANGYYTFNNLVPGVYHLSFAPPSGYALTGHDLGGDDTKDNDANESLSGRTVDETLVSGENNTTYDAGFYAAVSVGNLVWLDKNANGVQDAGEPGLAGVIAKLLNGSGVPVTVDADDNPIVDQVTDANGNYQFTNLIPGSYRVRFTNPDVRYTLSKANQGTDDAQDSDADATTFTTHTTTLTTGQYDPTLDAAYYIKGRVGNLAWHDINGNGVQDSGEPGLANTAVTLLGTDGFGGTISRTATTAVNGSFSFGEIIPGTYRIGFGIPAGGYVPTTADMGADDSTDSDYGPMGLTPVFAVQSADTILTLDAGYWLSTRIGSLVWDDTNGNGLQDAGEPGISGVSVILNGTEGDGDIVNLSTTTSATGEYTFGDQSSGSANLAPGTYNLTFVLPAGGYVPTRANDTDGTDSNDSDANEATGATAFEVLSSGENNPTYDAGFYLPPSIGNYVWTDVNANGLQDSDEPFIAGAQVILSGTDGQGTAVNQSKTTDIYGAFLFDNLLPGSYRLTFPTPSGLDRATYPNEGTDDSLDSDADPASGNTTVFEVLTSGEHNKTYDAAFFSFASIGDRVWEDYSANGVQDAGEPGLAGVSVALSGTTGNGTSVSRTAVTAADGSYLFNNLIPGTYKLTFTNPTGYLTTQAASPAGNSDTNSDADPVTGMTLSTVLVTGERDFTWDAGYYATDYGDLPSSYGTTNGASNGPSHILNPNLLLGLCADAELNGGNDTPPGTPVYGNCPAGSDDENGIVFVTPPVQGADACIRVTAVNTTGSTAVLQGWMDFNGDGDVQDAGEELHLTNNGIIPAGGVSDALYCFPVPAQVAFLNGSANIRFRLSPAGGLGPLGPAIGGEVEDYRVDVGRVGNLVWNDANFNGVQDLGEKGIADVPVELVWAGPDGDLNTNTDNRTYNTATNLSGQYYFSGIVKGTYRLRVLTPAMMSPARTDRGADDVRDSDGTLVNSDQSQVTQIFTVADPLNMPLGENSTGDQGVVAGYVDAQTDETHDFGFAWLDYGDLPQENTSGQSYNTTQSETGAVHATTPQLVLGTCTDAERDGQPDDDAGVYDELTTDSGDGDDGINNKGIDAQDCAGTPYAVVSASSYLCENRLIVRQINDRGSYVYYVVNGDFSPQINAAGGIAQVIGSTVIISDNAITGAYSGNQTALVSCISQNDGVAESLIIIGGTVTFNLSCFDKNIVCNDDENGIRFETPLIPDNDACIRVTARNTTPGSAVLQGWIDWNGNRQLEPSEALSLSGNGVIPSGGITGELFCFPVPASAVFNEGRVYARFRLSPAGGLSPDGPGIYSNDAMPAGEVEDYIVEVGLVGNLVWEDRNFDGLQGNPAIEPGMNGVDIQLTWAGPDNDLATTADNRTYLQKTATVNGKAGMYYFRGLTNGTYRLTSTTPTDFTPTRLNQGANDQLDADDFVNGDVFTWPDVSSLILNESGVNDMPGQMAIFPDRHDDQTHDMGYVALDFGDNPDSYSTLLPNGAHATIVPGLYLGSGVDSERDGAPDTESGVVAPGGDDNTTSAYTVGTAAGGDDENDLRFLTPLVPGHEACVEINTTATAPYTPAYLSAWMDYNGNDAFDTDEKITFTTINGAAANTAAPAVPTGTATRRYCFNVLSTATFTGGEAYVRLRLNTTPDIAPTGLVIYGEVEDHWQPLLMSGNYAWMDSDIEGDQDATEMALAGVPVQLRWAGEDQVFGNADDRLYETTTASDGRYRFFGLIPGPYRITPVKYTSTVSNPVAGVEPLGKILTIANLPPANDNNDSDASPSMSLTVPDMINTFTVTGEDGLNDNNGQNNAFPDNRENLSLDMGFINDPVFASALSIRGVAKSSSGICGQFDVIMDLCIRNTGKVPVNTLQAVLDLGGPTAFGSMFLGLTPGGAPQLLSSTARQNPVLNSGYNGTSVTSFFNGTSGLLWPDEQVCVRFRFELNPTAAGAPASPKVQAVVTSRAVNFQNVPVISYFTGAQIALTDLSDDGTDPATTNPLSPGDTGGTNDATPLTNCWDISQPLAQNDIVRISVDSTCVTTVYAGSVLEGEADKCLEDTYPLGGYYKVKLKNQNTGVEIPNPLTAAYIGQTIVVEIEHIVSCNKTWGKIRLEDNLAPILTCPADITVACSESTDIQNTGNVLIHDCTPTSVQIDNVVTDFDPCHTPRRVTERTFVVTDAWNNQSSCSQTITMIPFSLAEVDLPADITVNCESAYLNPGATAPAVTGQPSINGAPIGQGGYCSASIGYTDVRLEICKGSYEIYRTWIISNTCVPTGAGNAISHLQRILVEDAGGPQFACPGDITVSVDPTSCCATAALPEMILTEGCSDIVNLEAKVTGIDFNTSNLVTFTVQGQLSDFPGNNYWNADTLAVFPYTNCLPNNSIYTVQYTAEDECGNTSACNFKLTVADLVPPVAACDQFTQVGITGGGEAFIDAATLNDGSYDNCASTLSFKIRRMEANVCDDNSEFDDRVKVCCSDIGDTIVVVLRVYDIVLSSGTVAIDTFEGHYNDCMVQLLVEDKTKPTCSAPDNVTVTCEQFDPSLGNYGFATSIDNCCVDTIKVTNGYAQFDTLCNKGTVVRTFRAYDCAGNVTQCAQRIVVNYLQDYYVRFPDDKIITFCDGTGIYDEPTFYGEDCELLGVTFEDVIFTVVPDACFKIERNWRIINWCTFDPNGSCVAVPNPNPNAATNHPTNLPGPIVSPILTAGDPWKSTVVKVNPNDAQATNYSVFFSANANCYTYKQIIKITDSQDPVAACDDATAAGKICDETDNDGSLWNEMYWWDLANSSHDLCEAPSGISLTATDACSGANISFEYQLLLDLDGDGTMETVVNSTQLGSQPGGLGWNNIQYNNLNGTPVSRQFDNRAVAANQKWGFAIQEVVTGNKKTAYVKFNTQQAQNTFVTPQLPYGNHKIKWFVTDGCGNETICEYPVEIRDCKAPTVVCFNGLSVNIMPSGMISLNDMDLLQFTEDNHTQKQFLRTGVRKCGAGSGFPTDASGNPVTSVTFDCSELGTQCVEVWSEDLSGNAGYCEMYVIIQDNDGNCPSSDKVNVSGALKTEEANGVEDALVNIGGTSSLTVPFSFQDMTDSLGIYKVFHSVPVNASFTITADKDDSALNGVTTYDLVLISRHILGVTPLGSPYRMIAADANRSGSITTFDIVELRKLILGIYTELPNNTSWRFVDGNQVFTNPMNPFADTIREHISVHNALMNQADKHFTGVKIGDVNGTAIANTAMQADDRSNGTLLFDVDDRTVKAGETFEVTFKASEPVQGYQMTLNLKGLKVAGIVKSEKVSESNFGVFEDALTISIDGSEEFTVTFTAGRAGKLSEMLGVSSRITRAEAYSAANNLLDVALRFGGSTISGVGFELYQNQPNPFVNRTVIGFYLPEAQSAILTIADESGRIIYTQKGDYSKGYNAVQLDRALLNTTGVLYYTLAAEHDAATRKMIQLK